MLILNIYKSIILCTIRSEFSKWFWLHNVSFKVNKMLQHNDWWSLHWKIRYINLSLFAANIYLEPYCTSVVRRRSYYWIKESELKRSTIRPETSKTNIYLSTIYSQVDDLFSVTLVLKLINFNNCKYFVLVKIYF